jgi:predicted glutamine amidotransferase
VHNGYVGDFQVIRRDLMWAIDPRLFAGIVGSTDTEVVFRLALTFGLEEDPIRALERTVGLIETTATECGVAPMVQGTFGVSDGSSLWAVRYATEGRARSLFASADVDSLHRLYPEKKMWFATATSEDRLIASEPFSDLPGVWHEIDESSAVIVRSGGVLEHEPFRPQVPRATLSSP